MFKLFIVYVCLLAKHLSAHKKLAGFVISCLLYNAVYCQKNKTVTIEFQPVFGEQAFLLDSTYLLDDKNSIRFENLKFYISNIELLKNNKPVWKEKASYHLYDATNLSNAIQLQVPVKTDFDRIKFYLGIDSITNVSGAMGGDLDPTKGMYWAWQSGYINFKLEGTSSLCTNARKEFQLHLGGYQKPFNTLQTIFLTTGYRKKTVIKFDIKHFIELTNLKTKNHIMSPGEEAMRLSELIFQSFSIK